MMRSLRIGIAAASFMMLLPLTASAASEIHFSSDGVISARNVLVHQKNGNNLFLRAAWGQAFVRMVLLADASTTLTKGHGERATVADVKEKDIIDFDGVLSSGADSLTIIAKNIRDSSLQSDTKTLSGSVASLDANAGTFVLTNKTFGKTTVAASGATTTKGARTIPFAEMQKGDKVLSVSGLYDHTNNTLAASSMTVYQDSSVFKPRNFEGTLKSLSGTTLPITAVVTVGTTDYTVYFVQGASILSSSKKPAALTRFVVGDTVRFYGAIRKTNLTEVDAEVLRDLNF